jgi:hypothetical protein
VPLRLPVQLSVVPSGPIGGPLPIDVVERGFVTTVGLNYRFAPGIVVAKY